MNIRETYIDFFKSKNHTFIKSSPIIPENDPTSLFNVAGMQPLVPYLKGMSHPMGTRLVNYQKCVRTNDLEEVGDTTHHTFFEMLGNWSLGDYFKNESITWSFELLTKHLNIPINKLAVSVFKGNEIVSEDNESASVWESLGISKERIAYLGADDNWWPNMKLTGPCGPDTEIFYFRSNDEVPTKFDPNDERWVEIWNNVFMQYNHLENGNFEELAKKNVDTGMGLERVTAILEGVNDNYLSSLWIDVIRKIEEISNLEYSGENKKSMRIIADHFRAALFILSDSSKIKPSNTDQGYIVRRLIRRAIRHSKKLNIDLSSNFEEVIVRLFALKFGKYYEELVTELDYVVEIIKQEKVKFIRTLEKGLKKFEKIINGTNEILSKEMAFKLYDTYGFPIELTSELAIEHNVKIDVDGFNELFKLHQEKSRAGAINKFKGGLASTSDINIKYHTATHLLNAALKVVLGNHVHQKGSNINEERMRFDFSHDTKMTKEEIEKTEELVNQYINQSINVESFETQKEEAIKMNAEAMFIDKYGDLVTLYKIGEISLEFCGGPHVKNTSEIGRFKIVKEEASSAGVRRIKAIIE